jgi:hypothetical protein
MLAKIRTSGQKEPIFYKKIKTNINLPAGVGI